MTLNQLLTGIAKAGYYLSIGFDDDDLSYSITINKTDIIGVLSEYQTDINESLLNKAEGSGGSFNFEYDKDLNYLVVESIYNGFEIQDNEHVKYLIINDSSQHKESKARFPFNAFPEIFTVNKENNLIFINVGELKIDPQVIDIITDLLKEKIGWIQHYSAEYTSESNNWEDGEFQIEYFTDYLNHAYNITQGNGIEFFENLEIEELSTKEIEGLSKALDLTPKDFNKIISAIEDNEQ